MAQKRMFSKKIMQSDAFLGLTHGAQALYLQLNLEADDDGFVNNPKMIMRITGASTADFKELLDAKFIIEFERVIVIKHWKINNYIPADRYHGTTYTEEKEKLQVDENGAYTTTTKRAPKRRQSVDKMDTECIQDGDADKIRLDKNRIDKNSARRFLPKYEPIDYPEELGDLIEDFLEMRSSKKKEPTKKALQLILQTLDKESRGNMAIAKAMLEKAIKKNWLDVYPLDPEEKKKHFKKVEMPAPEPPKNPVSPEEAAERVARIKASMGGMFGGNQ